MFEVISSLKKVREDIESLYGANVRIFGQATTLDGIPENEEPTICILDVLASLKGYEVDLDDYFSDDEFEIFSKDEDNNFALYDIIDGLCNYGYLKGDNYSKADNSYNWCAPVDHHFDFKVFEGINGDVFVALMIHRFGDVRANYTDYVLLHFDNDYEFYEVLSENNKYIDITINDTNYEIEVNIFNDSYEVYEDGCYVCSCYGYDLDDIKADLLEKIA